MAEKIEVIKGQLGGRLILHDFIWREEIKHLIQKENIRELSITLYKCSGGDLSFLEELSEEIISLTLINYKLKDISEIHFLKNLVDLSVRSFCKTEIRFDNFPRLKMVNLEWRAKAKSIFESTTLEKVRVDHYSERDLSRFNQLKQLISLEVATCPVSEVGNLSQLENLKHLGIHYATKLTSLSGIEVLNNLEKLEVTHCRKITNIDPVSHLMKLKYLNIGENDKIESITPLRNLKDLEKVFIFETNILDGKIAFLNGLPKFIDTGFLNRKHYDIKNHNIGKDADGIPIEEKIKKLGL